jgi:cysteine desulfurase
MPVYLDHNATTPLDPRVLEAMLPYLGTEFGNPSSVHRFGRAARAALDTAREQVAALVNAQTSQVIFTSGGTEANNIALLGCCAALPVGRIAVSAIEHDSVRAPARVLAGRGWAIDTIAVDAAGRISAKNMAAALHPDTRLVSVMLANNESGVVQELPDLAATVRAAGVILHSDAVQAAGKITVDYQASGAHLMSLSGHKIYGPKGVGALIVDKALDMQALIYGGGQEKALRPGTENVAGIVGFGAAAQIAQDELQSGAARQAELRSHLEMQLRGIDDLVIFAADATRVPNTTQLSVPGIDGEALLLQLDRAGFAVSSASACAAGSHAPSHVMVAMGVTPELARGALRVSLGRGTTREQLDGFCQALCAAIAQFRSGTVRAAAGL